MYFFSLWVACLPWSVTLWIDTFLNAFPHIIQPLHYVHHSDQLLFHGSVGPGPVDQVYRVSKHFLIPIHILP